MNFDFVTSLKPTVILYCVEVRIPLFLAVTSGWEIRLRNLCDHSHLPLVCDHGGFPFNNPGPKTYGPLTVLHSLRKFCCST